MFKYALLLSLMLLGTWAQADTLHYEIYRMSDTSPPTLLVKDSKTYSEGDFQVKPLGEKRWSNSMELEQGFRIGVTLDQGAKTGGFTLWANHKPADVSNEQFRLRKADVYEKLEEGGLVSVAHHNPRGGHGISSITFDTDISLRIQEKDAPAPSDPAKAGTDHGKPLKTTYRVLIKQGSILNLPPTPNQ